MEIPVLTVLLVLVGIRVFQQLYRSYLADLGVARVGSFATGSRSLTRSRYSVFGDESGMTEDMAGSGATLGLLSRSESSSEFHMSDSLSDSELGSWACVLEGQLF